MAHDCRSVALSAARVAARTESPDPLTSGPMPPRSPLASRLATLTAAALLLAAAPATATAQLESTLRAAEPVPRLLRRDAPAAPFDPTDPSLVQAFGSVVNGVPVDGVGLLVTPHPADPRFAFFCTTQRIGPRTLLTAAHCVTDGNTGELFSTSRDAQVLFRGPNGSGGTLGQFFDVANIVVRPDWQGFNSTDYLWKDIAVVNFDDPLPSWVTTNELFTGNPLGQQSTHVGFGTFGTGTGATGFDGRRRWGTNDVDWIPSDPTWWADRMLLVDFDDGSANFDVFCLVGVRCGTGSPLEAGTAEGDSGGPLFVNGKLAGITSFGSYFCADAACTPYVRDPARPFDSFGSFSGFAPVARNLDFIAAASIPEPGTVTLVAGGLALLGLAARRRARQG